MKHKIVNKFNGAVLKEGFLTEYAAEEYLAKMPVTDKVYAERYYISVPYHWEWVYSQRHNGWRWMEKPYSTIDNS